MRIEIAKILKLVSSSLNMKLTVSENHSFERNDSIEIKPLKEKQILHPYDG
jgi:hypothetical protein